MRKQRGVSDPLILDFGQVSRYLLFLQASKIWNVSISADGSGGSAFQKHQLAPKETTSDTPKICHPEDP